MKNHEQIGQKPEAAETAPEAFEPIAELQKIRKLPHAEKLTALEAYKEKLFTQKEEIAGLEQHLIDEFQKNPDAPEEHFATLFSKSEKKLSQTQKEIVRDAIHEAVERRKLVQDLREEFPEDRELFNHLFGFYPSGSIRISLGALNLRIEVASIEDFAPLCEGTYIEHKPPTKRDFEQAKLIGGGAMNKYTAEGLPQHIAIVINNSPEFRERAAKAELAWTPDRLVAHEEQHTMNTFFNATRLKKYFEGMVPEDNAVPSTDEREWIEFHLRLARIFSAEWGDKDEILAFLRMGMPLELIEVALHDPDYLPSVYKTDVEETVESYAAKQNIKVTKQQLGLAFHKVFVKEMEPLLKYGLNAVKMLQDAGIDNDKVILLLANEPFAGWKKFAKRYLEEQIRHQSGAR